MRFKISGAWIRLFAYFVVIGGTAAGLWFSRDYWLPLVTEAEPEHVEDEQEAAAVDKPKIAKLSATARANLALVSKPALVTDYWRKIRIPGVIEDRPGLTDRGITAPLSGVVVQVHAFEGDIVRPGEKLFTLRLVSEYLQQTQSDLFKAVRETEILNREVQRIQSLVDAGTLPGKRIIELQQQLSRQDALLDAYRQELRSRNFSENHIAQVEKGEFVTSITIHTPQIDEVNAPFVTTSDSEQKPDAADSIFYEVQQLKVELGQQVEAGSSLAVLANHQSLYVKGHAFKREATYLANAAAENWPVEIEFTEDVADGWDEIEDQFTIRHLSNTTDPNSRTFDFFVPLENQSKVYEKDGQTFVIWRFRPGQRVTISVPVEEIKNVIVVPAEAVVFEGPEAFVFHQNGDLFNRIPVQVLHQDRNNVVIANDGTLQPTFYLAQNAAESLNRVMKSQAASGMDASVHVHADGTVHANH